jgi:PAS domain-containing protein
VRAGKPSSGAGKPRPESGPLLDGSPSAETEPADEADPADGNADTRPSPASERPYQTLFMEAPEAYVVTSAEGTVIDLNRHAEQLYKTRRTRLLGRHVTELADMDREWERGMGDAGDEWRSTSRSTTSASSAARSWA